MASKYAPVFVLDVDDAVNAGQTATISGLNQAFELVNVMLDGVDGCRATVKNSGSNAAVAFVAGNTNGQLDSTTNLVNANCSFASTAVITVEITQANATRIQLLCRAIDSVARSVTVTVS
jgi:hypothetical protein